MSKSLNMFDGGFLHTLLEGPGNIVRSYGNKEEWREDLGQIVDWDKWEELHGGHRNLVLMEKGKEEEVLVNIYWWDTSGRWPQIIQGIRIEDAVARHSTDIKGRMLVDPDKPVEVSDEGFLVTRLQYTQGENRYPWNEMEIASAARMMGELHRVLGEISVQSSIDTSGGLQYIHDDCARANMLFKRGSAEAVAVIDYENVTIGSRERDLGRTASFLLVDTKVRNDDLSLREPRPEENVSSIFESRLRALFENYDNEFDLEKAMVWAAAYLKYGDYGELNSVRDLALEYVREKIGGEEEIVELVGEMVSGAAS